MWKQEIIQYLYGMYLVQEDELWQDIENLVNLAPEIYFGNVNNWLDKKKYAKKDLPKLVNLPFDTALVEWTDNGVGDNKEEYIRVPKRAVLIHSNQENSEQIFYSFYYTYDTSLPDDSSENRDKDENRNWVISPVACIYSNDNEITIDLKNVKNAGLFENLFFNIAIQEAKQDFFTAKLLLDKRYYKPEKRGIIRNDKAQ